MKAKIKCVAVLSKAVDPFAVITARFGDQVYVHLDYEDRVELYHLWKSYGEGTPYAPQSLVRGHAIDVETGVVGDAGTLSSRRGDWMNAEGLWMHSLVARNATNVLARWRVDHPQRDGGIAAPNWRCLTAIRALAIAAGLPDPGVNSVAARREATP